MTPEPDDLSARLRALPTEISPRRDLLPEIEARLARHELGTASRERFPIRRVLAAAALFAAGVLAGRMTGAGTLRPTATPVVYPSSDFAAAAEVQRAGTAYVTALAHVVDHVASTAMREQAEESAANTLASAVRQLDALNGAVSPIRKF